MRARTSSLRLVSCVELESIACGQRFARSAVRWWNADTETPNRSGSRRPR